MTTFRKAVLYKFVREERLFCAILAHLLLQQGPNLTNFLGLINSKIPPGTDYPTSGLDNAEVYFEFSFLRDHWHSLCGNEAKRKRIFSLLSRVKSLEGYKSEEFQGGISDFNSCFMGKTGERIKKDISYPGRWSVKALHKSFGHNGEEFRDVCRFKWSFNIKPDMVILIPGCKPLCIEAKLESKPGKYPSNRDEQRLFDEKGLERVGQIELQQFMFDRLLESECHSVVINRTGMVKDQSSAAIGWKEIFSQLETHSSIPYVRMLIDNNQHL